MSTQPWLSDEQWVTVTAPLTNGSDNRSPGNYLRVINQFPVESHKRYQPTPFVTWCNIFVGDTAPALGVLLPHWIRGLETRANDLADWLEHRLPAGGTHQGPEHGWREVKLQADAIARANAGFPTVASWKNPNPKLAGHIAWLMPTNDGKPKVAQAGRTNFAYGDLAAGFGKYVPRYFTHD